MSFIIETVNGIRYDFEEIGLKPINFEINSPSPRIEREIIEGRDGHVDIDTTYEGRSIRAFFLIQAKDFTDYHVIRHEIYRLFNPKTMFYIIDSRLPYMRWEVRTSASFSPERINSINGLFTLELISPSSYAESYGSTLAPYNYNGELWQIGAGLESVDLNYIHTTTNFSIYNGSDISIDPRNYPLQIQFAGASENLTIRNLTTGDEWIYTGSSAAEDTIILDGIKSHKNTISIFGQTNRKLITLAPGINEFEVLGATDPFTISFDFRFYYL